MSNWEENSILIERYLDGELTAVEKADFEKQLAEDSKLAAEFELQKQIRKDIRLAGERKELRSKLNEYHKTYFEYPGSTEGKIVPFKRRSVVSIVAIAAGVSLVIAVGSLSIYHYGFKKLKQKNDYVQTDREAGKSTSDNKVKNEKAVTKKSILDKPSRAATAFALAENGWVVTSYHTVKGEKTVTLERVGSGFETYEADVKFFNKKLDIAILKINDKNFKGFGKIPYSFTDGNAVIAQDVFSLGFPKDDIVYTEGSISSLSGYKMDTLAYQAGIMVNPGNSGAPLFNVQGDIIGVIAGKNASEDGASYAIKGKYLINMIKHIKPNEADQPIVLPSKNLLKGKKATDQVKMIEPFVFIIKA